MYIYTLPKAGTYFLATVLEMAGYHNTGYHISRNAYLDTKSVSLETNAKTPDAARVDQFFVPVVRSLKSQEFAFGHFALPHNLDVVHPSMVFVCAYRDPQKTLVSEFVDFRFRREDVNWLSPGAIEDDCAAFELYLERHGLIAHLNIFDDFVCLANLVKNERFQRYPEHRFHFVNFDSIRGSTTELSALLAFLKLDHSPVSTANLLSAALGADTKTKADKVSVSRERLWSGRAQEMYLRSDFPALVARCSEIGLKI